MHRTHFDKDYKVSLVQSNLNMLKWGNRSLDTSFTITENLVYEAARNKPDIIIMPESALLCYLAKRPALANRVKYWADSIKIPLVLGGLNWEKAPPGARYDYFVYNTAFLVKPFKSEMEMYYKIKLVPFSEAMPFEANFPILSRVNLGEADFQRGTKNTIFSDEPAKLHAAPFICYEIIYPGFVQKRLREGKANLIVNITNDGWFGKTSGPFQHAMMSRLRTIENGVPLVRCANSGISMIVNKYGVVEKKTSLYERSILNGEVALAESSTIYSRYGDWFVLFCGTIVIISFASMLPVRMFRKV
jgi:apolipoprotein N-acyltransferase